MSSPKSPPSGIRSPGPHLVSLVLHSKKALQHGEQLCSRASDLSRTFSQSAVELLALDAKVRWIAQGIQEQLDLAVQVAKSIEVQRNRLDERARHWDQSRALHTGNLDEVLESLGAQHVPPDFHQSSSSSSLFGDPNSDDEETHPPVTKGTDRSKWKTLRDFVDERGIEDAVEGMDNDRMALDDLLAVTETHPQVLLHHAANIHDSLLDITPLPSMHSIFTSQERASENMARHLESLAAHYDQMAVALRDKESGDEPSEDDLQEMNRDTEELPAIIAELDEDVTSIETSYQNIEAAKQISERFLNKQREILDHLDELGDLMSEMLEQQLDVEAASENHIATLQSHTETLENLHATYTAYRASYNTLLLEMDRRRRYRDATELIVREMGKQLEGLRDEELHARDSFYASHGPHLPDDLCLCISNLPTKWEVMTAPGEAPEVLPDIDEDLLDDVRKKE